MNRVLHNVTALAAVVPSWESVLEVNPVPAFERRLVCEVPKSDREETLKIAVGRDPGAADCFPVGCATLR